MLRSALSPATLAARTSTQRPRCLATVASETVRLAFEKQAADDSSKAPLVVLHGLFGSKQNWRSLAKGLAQRLGRDIFTLVRPSLGMPGWGRPTNGERPTLTRLEADYRT